VRANATDLDEHGVEKTRLCVHVLLQVEVEELEHEVQLVLSVNHL
jgi:hypothetical protein